MIPKPTKKRKRPTKPKQLPAPAAKPAALPAPETQPALPAPKGVRFPKKFNQFRLTYQKSRPTAVKQYINKESTSRKLFQALDVNKNGFLTRKELKRFASSIGYKLRSLLEEMDTNGDGRVSKAEFNAWRRKTLAR